MTGRSVFCQLFALLTLSVGLAAPALAADDAGKNSEMIVNGQPVEEGQIPWQVFLTRSWTDANGDRWVSWCGGPAMGADRRPIVWKTMASPITRRRWRLVTVASIAAS
jgi:secreted trypsin-like serine protease